MLPARRSSPTKSPNGTNWSDHKPDLKEDFHSHCGYCGSFDGFRNTYFEVDHFVPKSLFIENGNIDLCHYDNLTYSCKFCNNAKRAKWPTDDENVSHNGNEGFIDACDIDYDNHLFRTQNGSIMWNTPLGKWMATTGFKFDERQRSISILWNLSELFRLIEEIELQKNQLNLEASELLEIDTKLGNLAIKYFKYHKELIEFYNE